MTEIIYENLDYVNSIKDWFSKQIDEEYECHFGTLIGYCFLKMYLRDIKPLLKLMHSQHNQHKEWFERPSALLIWRMQLSQQEGHLATGFLNIKATERLWETDLEGGETFI